MAHLVAKDGHLLAMDLGGGHHLSGADDACDCCEQGTIFPTCDSCIASCTANQYQVELSSTAGVLGACSSLDGTYILSKQPPLVGWRYQFPNAQCGTGPYFDWIELDIFCFNEGQTTQNVRWELKILATPQDGASNAVRIWRGIHSYPITPGVHQAPLCCEIPNMDSIFPNRPATFPFDDDGVLAPYRNCCEIPNISLDGLSEVN